MKQEDQREPIHRLLAHLGKTYIILLKELDAYFGSPLSMNEKVVLQVLDEEAICIKEVSARTGLALSTLTHVFDRMEGKRLIRRGHSRADRRIVRIELDVAGRRLKSKFGTLIEEISTGWLDMFPEKERRVVTRALERGARVLLAEAQDAEEPPRSSTESMLATAARLWKNGND